MSSSSPTAESGPAPIAEREARRLRTWSTGKRYGFAVANVCAAAGLAFLFRGTPTAFTPIFFAAVMGSAWYGGMGPGLLATTLSVISVELLMSSAALLDGQTGPELVRLSLFAAVAIATSAIQEIWRNDKLAMLRINNELERRVRERTEALLRLNQQLRAEISERERAEAQLRSSEERFRELFEYAPVSYHELDESGVLRRVNRAECEVLGYSAGEMIGRPVWEFVSPESRTLSERTVREKLKQGSEILPFVRPYQTRDGRRLWFEIHERLIRNASGQVVGLRSALLDITSRIEADEEIRRLNSELEQRVEERTAELQRSNEDLQQFAYVASHDLQEPLRIISGYADLVCRRYRGKIDQDADDFLKFMMDASQRMSRMITDLLAFSRVGSRDQRPFGPVSLQAAIEEAAMNLEFSIEESGARIEWPEKLPEVWGDSPRLVQLIQNLLSNAIKYRGAEPPLVRITAVQSGEMVECSVSDNGVGFDMRYAEKVFGVFRRLHGAEYPGTGIGLAIAKRITDQHGGRIWVSSKPGAGTTFFFTLKPAERMASAAGAASSS